MNPVTEVQAQEWIKRDKIRIYIEDSKVACAAQIATFETSMEIVRIATHTEFLRQGYASKLLRQILMEASEAGKSSVHLKVESARTAAIATYKKLGFIEDPEKSQIWHSRWY